MDGRKLLPLVTTLIAIRGLIGAVVFAGALALVATVVLAGPDIDGDRLDDALEEAGELADIVYESFSGDGGFAIRAGDAWIELPVLETSIDATVRGEVQTLHVTQVFSNPSDTPVEARYVFPLPRDAAVYGMTMTVGDERIRADMQEREEAIATFEAAADNGQAAALLTQERPNVFTQRVANLMPGHDIVVELEVVQTSRRVDGAYELAIPLVVGPRFTPPSHDADADGPVVAAGPADATPIGGLTAAAPDPRVSITVDLQGGVPLQRVSCRTHRIDEDWRTDDHVVVTLADGRIVDDRDFVLEYAMAGDDVAAAALTHHDERGGFFTLRVEPPAHIAEDDVRPREMVFVLDASGSMSGEPMGVSRALVREALTHLRPGDTFRLVQFGNDAVEFAATPLLATPSNIERGLAWVDSVSGMGGTMMVRGIEQALAPPVPDGALRIVVFLTDGYIGNEAEVLARTHALVGDARVFAVGVGNGVNRYLLSELGDVGRGFSRFVDLSERADVVAADLASRWQTPVLTDIEVDWGDAPVTDVTPSPIRDLFAGHAVRVFGRWSGPGGSWPVVVSGRRGDERVDIPLTLTLERGAAAEAIAITWARARVDALMDEHALAARQDPDRADALRAEVTELGLTWQIATRWTAFVAVSERIVNPSGDAARADVALPMVDGVGMQAYGSVGGPSGGAAPEPGTLLGLLLAGAATAAGARRRREESD